MNEIDWKRKLCSRKLWMAIVGFVTGLVVFLGDTAEHAEKLGALILSAASVLAYILGEGLADSGNHVEYLPVEVEYEDEEEEEEGTAPLVPFVPPEEDEDDGK